MKTKNKVTIKSLAYSLPETCYTNNDAPYSEISDIPPNWWKFWGVNQRYLISEDKGENEITLAKDACEKAIKQAGIKKSEIDLVLMNTSSPYLSNMTDSQKRMFPRLSQALVKELGLNQDTLNWDVEVECASFLYNLQIATNMLRTNRYHNILICSCEYVSKLFDFSSKSCTVFGDAAAAAVITNDPDGDSDLISSAYISDSTLYDLATIKWRYPTNKVEPEKEDYQIYFSLLEEGQSQIATFMPDTLPNIIKKALAKVKMEIEEMSAFVFHQPSVTIIDLWANRLGGIKGKYHEVVSEIGCVVSAAVPIALYKTLKEKTAAKDDYVALSGAGIGWGYGAQVWKLGNVNI